MNINDFRPAHEFAVRFGIKSVVYGPPGSGKSPICIQTAPRPCALMTEPGFLSLRKSNVPTYPAFTPSRIQEFFDWLAGSNEHQQFDTIIIDSTSQMCEIIVDAELGSPTKGGNEQHGLRAYGKMSRKVMGYMNQLYFMPQKNVILISKLQNFEINGTVYKRPYYPGKELPVRIPHLFDLIMYLGPQFIPGAQPSPTTAFRAREQFDTMARDRSGNLAEYEPPDMNQVFSKAMR